MPTRLEVVYENGVLRPIGPLSSPIAENQRLRVIIEDADETDHWLADADSTIDLEDVRRVLAKTPGTIAELIRAERAES